jgi:arginase
MSGLKAILITSFCLLVIAIFSLSKNVDKQKVSIVLQPFSGSRSGQELSPGPELMYKEAVKVLAEAGIEQTSKEIIKLYPEEEKDYGVWHRVGLANGHLGRTVAPLVRKGIFPLGLLSNCNSLTGMLAGLQHSGPSRKALTVGLVWLDAHGDFNTPETTLSGMLGGMPVAVAAGKCLFRLRLKAGLDPAISTRNIIMMGLRDVDPLEQSLIDESHIISISTEEMVSKDERFTTALNMLAERVDVIYVHIDLDVLDAADIPGHNFEVPNGPTAAQLSEVLRYITKCEKVKALGIASFPSPESGRKKSMASTMALVKGTMEGLKMR